MGVGKGKVIIVYASLTGNTEEMAELIAAGLRDSGVAADLKMVEDCSASSLLDYDAYLLGAYTWGDGELPDEFLDFTEEMQELDLSGKLTAIFGSGDTAYHLYCGAVDELEEKVKAVGSELALESLKIELGPSKEEQAMCREFGAKFAKSLLAVI